MPAPAVAERGLGSVRVFARRASHLIPLPDRLVLPDPRLPFDERFRIAESLPVDKKVVFLRGEIATLLPSAAVDEKAAYSWALLGWGSRRLEIDNSQINDSSLPEAIKKRFLNLPADEAPLWGNLQLGLFINSPQVKIPSFAVALMRPGQKPLYYWGIKVTGQGKEYLKPHIVTEIEPFTRSKNEDDRNLHILCATAGSFAIARELIRFAHQVISARTQPPTPTPAAA